MELSLSATDWLHRATNTKQKSPCFVGNILSSGFVGDFKELLPGLWFHCEIQQDSLIALKRVHCGMR